MIPCPHECLNVSSCKDCGEIFQSKPDLMRHRKQKHRSKVFECRDFAQGKCTFQESVCWFLHGKVGEDHDDLKDTSETKEQDFHEAQENIPPDQMALMINLIRKLSLQVEMLEKKSMRNL